MAARQRAVSKTQSLPLSKAKTLSFSFNQQAKAAPSEKLGNGLIFINL